MLATAGGRALAGLVGRSASRVLVVDVEPSSSARHVQTAAHLMPDPLKSPVEPWPYRDRGFTSWDFYTDGTYKRISNQSRIIVVEGNIGSGKSTLAKRLAEELGFYYIPEFSLDMIRVNSYGVDQKDLYDDIPRFFQYGDIDMFYRDPESVNVTLAQSMMLYGRHEQWCNAMAHLLNTGQGVVLDRSIFSDFVFVNALKQKGLIGNSWFRFYHNFRRALISSLENFYPHLVIYLDTPVDKCMENIKQRGRPAEVESKFLDEEYLGTIEASYKDMLAEIRRHSKMLIFDWQNVNDSSADRVIEDVVKVDLDFYEWHSMTQMEAWYELDDDIKWGNERLKYTNKVRGMNAWDLWGVSTDVPEFSVVDDDLEQYFATLKQRAFKDGYAYGYHPSDGRLMDVLTTFHWRNPTGIKPWYEHYWKDTFFSVHPGTFRTEFGDWWGDKNYTPGYASGHH